MNVPLLIQELDVQELDIVVLHIMKDNVTYQQLVNVHGLMVSV